jgi:hypothetical protein
MIIRRTKKIPFKLDASQGASAFSAAGGHSLNIVNGGPCLKMQVKNKMLFGNPAPLSDRHPWNIYLTWVQGDGSAIKHGWHANIEPGFVNGLDPIIQSENAFPKEIKVTTSASNVKTAYAFGRVASKKDEDGMRVPGLMERPMVWMPPRAFTNIMAEGKMTPRNAIAFFEKKYGYDSRAAGGIGGGQTISSSNSGAGVEIQQNQVSSNVWVGASDVYLSTARAASQTKSSMGIFPITAIEYNTEFNDKALQLYGSRTRVRFGSMPQKPSLQARAALTVLGLPYEDDGEDHVKVATIYIMAAGEPAAQNLLSFTGSELWFVQHSLFWNLEYRPRYRDPVNLPPMNASLAFLPLVGRYSIAPIAIAATFESMLNAAIAGLLNQESNEGKYWTV